MSNVSEFRLALHAAGFDPVAVNGKRPIVDEWQTKVGASAEEISSWGGTGTGMLTRRTPTFDGDIMHPEAAAAFEEMVKDWFDGRGPILVRIGLPPKRAIPFRTNTPFKKMVQRFIAPNGSEHKIEILCDGQQVLVDGIHPDTKKPYAWHGGRPGTVAWSDLPETDEREAAEFLELCSDMLCERFGFKRVEVNGHGARATTGDDPFEAHAEHYKSPVDVEAEFAGMAPNGERVNAVQTRVIPAMIGRAIHPDEVLEIVVNATMAVADRAGLGWSREEEAKCVGKRIDSALHNLFLKDYDYRTGEIPKWLPEEFRARWAEVLSAGRRPTISRNGSGWHVRSYGQEKDTENNPENDGTFALKWFKPIDPARMPPRQFLYGHHYQRGTVSATVAPGGVGKTSVDMVEAIALATCRNLLGEQPKERCRVWLHNGEDTREELERRVVAICQYYEIPQQELDGWLVLTSGTELGLKVANGYNELKIDAPLIDKITKTIVKYEFDVFVVDPLVTLHSVPESDNGKMDTVLRIFTRIANVCDCAIDIAHHTRKLAAGISEHTVDDARGASAIRDAVRAMRILNVMSLPEAGKLGLDEFERLYFFRVDRGKANTVPPARRATWRKFENVELPNGDAVGVVTAWEYPDEGSPGKMEAEHRADALFLRLLDRLWEQGRYLNNSSGPNYAPAVMARESEAKAARVGKAALADAMRRLFTACAIKIEDYGNRGGRRITRTSPPVAPTEVD